MTKDCTITSDELILRDTPRLRNTLLACGAFLTALACVCYSIDPQQTSGTDARGMLHASWYGLALFSGIFFYLSHLVHERRLLAPPFLHAKPEGLKVRLIDPVSIPWDAIVDVQSEFMFNRHHILFFELTEPERFVTRRLLANHSHVQKSALRTPSVKQFYKSSNYSVVLPEGDFDIQMILDFLRRNLGRR